MLSTTWQLSRTAQRIGRRITQGPDPAREELVREFAPGRSFVDVGCMWSINGALTFLAEESGATQVTGVDVVPRTPEFDAEYERRNSQIRFVQGDLHRRVVGEEIGEHEVVFCDGVLYHTPSPLLTLERLRAICSDYLIMSSATIPEMVGIQNGAVLYAGLSDKQRKAYQHKIYPRGGGGHRLGVDTPFNRDKDYDNWWWGFAPSTFASMVDVCGFDVLRVSEYRQGVGTRVVARKRPGPYTPLHPDD